MTLPMRGVWRNSRLNNVLTQHGQVAQKNTGSKLFVTPAAIPDPPNKTHLNAHVASSIPGKLSSQQPKLNAPTATASSDKQTQATRSQKRFIPGTASASAQTLRPNAKGL